jgi:hypothetical protein
LKQKENLMRALTIVGSAIALAACLAIGAQAQDTAQVRRLTILSFSSAVQVPGATLPAGKYRFEMADESNAPHVVRVSTEDGQKVLATFSTIPRTIATRDLRDQETLIMFAERPAGAPQAAREWFYPGRSIGEEFVYPKDTAVALAKANHTTVAAVEEGQNGKGGHVNENGELTTDSKEESKESNASASNAPAASTTAPAASTTAPKASEGSAASNEPAASTTAPRNQVARAQTPSTTTPAPSPSAPARPSTSAPAQTAVGTSGQAPANTAPAQKLPRTASPLGLFELLGALSIGAAFGVRRMRAQLAAGR